MGKHRIHPEKGMEIELYSIGDHLRTLLTGKLKNWCTAFNKNNEWRD
ncbi:hypothetical protein QGM71_12160 [Virgibacillus sp. C22-A2]|uniref:Uncharacterized protein n=1 Tax=Virgibacillus tibetensis TaxID=3042313 RepID=A0ABU6KH79_9BACI|nr:hypothetical protein [Virgibacillus sp. C22-A2]